MNANQQIDNTIMTSPLRIDNSMTIYQADELKMLFQNTLANVQSLAVDLSAVSEIDTTGLQLLLALRCEKKPVALINPSHCIKQLTELLHIYDFMEFTLHPGA